MGIHQNEKKEIYEGPLKDDKRHGHGTLKSTLKSLVQEGEWVNGVKHGKFRVTSSKTGKLKNIE